MTPAEEPPFESLPGRPMQLGSLEIRRLLPTKGRRLVGPWCFLDGYGPLAFERGKPMDVAPHPHIGLQTVTWLLQGEVLHRDSLETEAVARPGTLNLMTAGRGIAHSEETPLAHSGVLEGVQLWVALPDARRNDEPSFGRHAELPVVELRGGRATVILGEWLDRRSPGLALSPMVGADVSIDAGETLELPLERPFEHALVPLLGRGAVEGRPLAPEALAYAPPGRSGLRLSALGGPLRVLLLGGAPFGERVVMWWNFVARTPEEIDEARADWQAGRRFGPVRGYHGERIEAPELVGRPAAPPMS
jgi:redox-sensitive bicupin YhaK (pirin superfamily)